MRGNHAVTLRRVLNRNDEARMSNDEGMTKPQIQSVRSTSSAHLIIRYSFELRNSDFGIRGRTAAASHMLDDVIAELRALDFGRAVHQARENRKSPLCGSSPPAVGTDQIEVLYPSFFSFTVTRTNATRDPSRRNLRIANPNKIPNMLGLRKQSGRPGRYLIVNLADATALLVYPDFTAFALSVADFVKANGL